MIFIKDIVKISADKFDDVYLSIVKDIRVVKYQSPLGYPAQAGFFFGRGAEKQPDMVIISGFVTDDAKWGSLITLGTRMFNVKGSPRKAASKALEELFEKQIPVIVTDKTIGRRPNLVITGLEMYPHPEYSDTTQFEISLTEQRILEDLRPDARGTRTIDPFSFYDYDELGIFRGK